MHKNYNMEIIASEKAFCNKSEIKHTEFEAFIEKSTIKALDNESVHKIEIVLDR